MEIAKQITDTLEGAVADFNKSIPGIQSSIADEVENLIRNLDLKGNTVISNAANLRKIGAFKIKVKSIIKDSGYADSVADFMQSFDDVDDLLTQYFQEFSSKFNGSAQITELKAQSIENTLSSLTESGLYSQFIEPIQQQLQLNVTTGTNWQKMAKSVRTYIEGNSEQLGGLERYAKQITTGSINTFAGQYINIVSRDLGLNWFRYVGPIMDTSRPWCRACHKKQYLHRSEFPDLLVGDFPEFKEFDGVIYAKTGLPAGMDADTTVFNLNINCGGRKNNCNHQMLPVDESAVPAGIRAMIED
jgi:hypothetical protein